MVLLHFLRWLKGNHAEYEFDVLLLAGGEFEQEFRSLAEVFVMPNRRESPLAQRFSGIKKRIGIRRRVDEPGLPPFSRSYDLVVGNTILTLPTLEHFKLKGVKTICWIHELHWVVRAFYSDREFTKLLPASDKFIAASAPVKEMLEEFGISKGITVVHDFSTIESLGPDARIVTRGRFHIPDEAFVVCGSGMVVSRKGTDLFVRIAESLIPVFPDTYFVWVGDGSAGWQQELIATNHEIRNSNRLIFTGSVPDPQNMFAASDLFAMTSREDPFPLVCLEAAGHGKPVICFEDAGGMPHFVGNDAGAAVPFEDTSAFSEKIVHFYNDREALQSAGRRARARVETEFSAERSCKLLEQILGESV